MENMANDTTVGGPIQLATITWDQGFRKVSEQEILRMIEENQSIITGYNRTLNALFLEGRDD
jgi:20S proteasome alpha/beta subunit